MSEFDLIDRIRRRALQRDDVILGIGDDAAILQVPAGLHLVVATDTLNIGVHFPEATAPADIGWKALAVNLSDLAAMGAQPAWCTLSLSMPHSDAASLEAFVEGFLDGFVELASHHHIALVGGDTTRGPLSVCVTVHGFVEPGRALRRTGAKVGDDIWVSGTLGDAAGALALLLPPGEGSEHRRTEPAVETPAQRPSGEKRNLIAPHLLHRLDRPTPRIAVGRALAGVAHSAIDVSDGLLADLGHVCRASGIAAELQLDALPYSQALNEAFDATQRGELQAGGGDDYELCFTAPAAVRERIEGIAKQSGVPMTRIGRSVEGEGVRVMDGNGERWQPRRAGYSHFSE